MFNWTPAKCSTSHSFSFSQIVFGFLCFYLGTPNLLNIAYLLCPFLMKKGSLPYSRWPDIFVLREILRVGPLSLPTSFNVMRFWHLLVVSYCHKISLFYFRRDRVEAGMSTDFRPVCVVSLFNFCASPL